MRSTLDSQIQQFLQERNKVEERRKLWNDNIKGNLEKQLNYYIKTFSEVGWHMSGHNDQKNYESVYLSINNVPSGINHKEGKLHMLIGGAMHFSQNHNGKLTVWMEYPYVEDIAYYNPSHEVFEEIEPKDLNNDKIDDLIIQFMNKLNKTSLQDQRRPIGYH